ncbi:MAG: hypothetical protein WCK32_00385 [Chlorobiaceae bacterium]
MDSDKIGHHSKTHLEENICIHIFSVSAAMVGVCLTVIGIIQVVIKTQGATTLVDDFLSIDALLFLISCIFSYWAMRRQGLKRMHQIERIADIIFMIALIFMVVICVLITYEVSYYKTVSWLNHGMRWVLSA